MKTYEIDANGNALILLQVDGEHIEVLDAIDGYGNTIKSEVSVKEWEE